MQVRWPLPGRIVATVSFFDETGSYTEPTKKALERFAMLAAIMVEDTEDDDERADD